MPYDIVIKGPEGWDDLVQRGLGNVIDPLVLRLGQFFLEGGPASATARKDRWTTIESDLGALASFFDLVVLNDQLPAFNYHDTFDLGLDFGDGLGAVLNTPGDKTLVHVDVERQMYRAAKDAALDQLSRRMAEGPFVSKSTAETILATLVATQYEWEPSLETLEPQMKSTDEMRLARFLLGQLVFAGYAQQTGAPHVLAPKRSLALAAVGLGAVPTAISEDAVYDELRRRLRDAGTGWRDDDLPWTPSFLPFLVERTSQYREGPDVLLERAKELRTSNAIEHYRKLRAALISEDAERSADARAELRAAADSVARSLHSNQQELQLFQHVTVEVLPQAFGVVGGALVGTLVAGPPGAIVGGLAGLIGQESLKPVQRKLWAWFLDGLPFRSARKLLARSVRAEYELKRDFAPRLQAIWETGRRNP